MLINPLKVAIYHKPSTDQYLNFDSNHYLVHKGSVVKNTNTANTVISKKEDTMHEIEHLRSILCDNKIYKA